MFDSAKEWMSKGRKERIIGFLIILIAVYSLLWTIVEPLVSSRQIFGPDAIDWWWKVQIGLCVLFSIIVFFSLLPKKILESFGFELIDTKLNTAFKAAIGSPKIHVITDGYYGEVLHVDGNYENDALDCKIQPIAQKASSIKYIYFPITSFIFYIHVNLISKNSSTKSHGWIGFRTNITKPSGAKGQGEYSYPVISQNAKNGWLYSTIEIEKVINETFGHEGYKYCDLIELRVRGEGKLQKIIIR
jgi:hypothetical protein